MMGPSFVTKERLAVWTKDGRKVPIFREKDAFCAIPGCRSENALLGAFPKPLDISCICFALPIKLLNMKQLEW
jgi:hypothetical protein